MLDEPVEPSDPQHRLCEVLLDYLLAAGLTDWPGGDGMTVNDVVLTYHEYAAAGRVPWRWVLVQNHPDLSDRSTRSSPRKTAAREAAHRPFHTSEVYHVRKCA
jgi:hypothetical protein